MQVELTKNKSAHNLKKAQKRSKYASKCNFETSECPMLMTTTEESENSKPGKSRPNLGRAKDSPSSKVTISPKQVAIKESKKPTRSKRELESLERQK